MLLQGLDQKVKPLKLNELLGGDRKKSWGPQKMKERLTMCMKTNSNKFQHFESETMYMKSKDL